MPTCPHCGNDCSPRAAMCPKCGEPLLDDALKELDTQFSTWSTHEQKGTGKVATPSIMRPLPNIKLSPDSTPSSSSPIEAPRSQYEEEWKIRDKEPTSIPTERSKDSSKIDEQSILTIIGKRPMDIRDIITKMGITDMSDARYLQIQLRRLEESDKLIVEIKQGRKLYRKIRSIKKGRD